MPANKAEEERPQTTNTALLRKLSAAIDRHAAVARFACGGSIPILDITTSTLEPDQ